MIDLEAIEKRAEFCLEQRSDFRSLSAAVPLICEDIPALIQRVRELEEENAKKQSDNAWLRENLKKLEQRIDAINGGY